MHLLSDYDYSLPDELIAQVPLQERTSSRLLSVDRKTGALRDLKFIDLITILEAGDLLILNDTRVTARRLIGAKPTGGAVEALLLEESAPLTFRALTKPAKRLQVGQRVDFEGNLPATVLETLSEGHRLLKFEPVSDFHKRLDEFGSVPLPPYIHTALSDPERYQTVIAAKGGSSAAPTAALHFSSQMLAEIAAKGVEIATVTLDVGIDTFRPVTSESLKDHKMHGERCTVSMETAEKVRSCRGRVIAVGTTSVRTLETHALAKKHLEPGTTVSKLFITPGFSFKIVDGIITNFHLPKTTMLMMISAFSSRETILAAYEHAVESRYRFLSFGDSMLIL